MMRRAIAAIFMVAAPLSGTAAQSAPARIRLGTLAPRGTSYHRILQEMGERWRNLTNGQVQLTIYAGTMGSEVELVRRMRLGQLQAATITIDGLREIDPGVAALQLIPMMFRSLEELDFVRSRLEPLLARRLAERGFVVLFWADAGWVHFFSRQPANRPDDFRRFRLFVTSGAIEQFDLMRSAGYSPVALEWSDALTALQTGMIEAIPTIPYFALAMQYYTVANHMLAVNWAPVVGATIINRRSWESMPAEQRDVLQRAAVEAGRRFQASGRALADSAVAAMRARGLQVHSLTPPDEAAWRSASEAFYPRIRGGMVPADMFDEVVRLLAEYRSRPGARD
jgi:TRAP-type C4-dicarboxylate transport system substrate-binding protein